ncbi:ATP synthase F1 subunit gamma [Candidatus Dojkabacteria bacterium]|nr:ATP synthase F1 subunit gamma [Candidatus Dojkabacteria bacterium]
MANTREIKRRINSIQNTAQITKALQMVSASKMQKAQTRAEESIPYSEGLYELVKLIGNLEDFKSPYLREVEEVRSIALVIIGPSRGFVGALTSNLTIEINKSLKEFKKEFPNAKINSIAMHKVGKKIADLLHLDVTHFISEFKESPDSEDIETLKTILINGFQAHEFDQVYLAYTHFVNTLTQEPKIKKILPIEFKENGTEKEQSSAAQRDDFIFEPGKKDLLDSLLPEYFENQILTALLESIASEHSARMVSMQNATDNALELIGSLNLEFNKSRQAKITNEIIDIVSGSINK